MRGAWTAVLGLVVWACGGKVAGERPSSASDAAPEMDSATTITDAGPEDADAGDAADAGPCEPPSLPIACATVCGPPSDLGNCSETAEDVMGIPNGSPPSPPPAPGALYFWGNPLQDFLDYFQQLAQLYALVVPAHGVDCTPSGVDAGACTYAPWTPQLDAADIHYSTPDHGFVGPDGHPYVFVYLPGVGAYYVIDADRACATYQLGLEYNECLLGPLPADAAPD
jgi:hypothetical protein